MLGARVEFQGCHSLIYTLHQFLCSLVSSQHTNRVENASCCIRNLGMLGVQPLANAIASSWSCESPLRPSGDSGCAGPGCAATGIAIGLHQPKDIPYPCCRQLGQRCTIGCVTPNADDGGCCQLASSISFSIQTCRCRCRHLVLIRPHD